MTDIVKAIGEDARQEERLDIARRLLKRGDSVEEVQSLLNLDADDLEKIQKDLH